MMRVGHLSIGYVFLLVGITASCRPGDGAEPISCLESVFAEHAASQRAWQESLRDIIVSQRPEFAELASISKQLQLAMIDMTEARFHYVIASPERLEGQYGISEFVDLGVVWTDADETALSYEAPDYLDLVRQADSLRAINNGHPDWPPLRAYVTEELMGAPAFTGALQAGSMRDGVGGAVQAHRYPPLPT
jgi:hypothetical protein